MLRKLLFLAALVSAAPVHAQRDTIGRAVRAVRAPIVDGRSDDAVWATADYACGDVLAVHCLTVHRACPNLTRDRVRISADFRYEPAGRPNLGASSTFDPKTSPPTTGPTGT